MPDAPAGYGAWGAWVWLNGSIVPAAEARVSVFDRGMLLGDGVYETLRIHHGKIFRWGDHAERLSKSLDSARIDYPAGVEALKSAIAQCVQANGMREARVRLTITRGEGDPGYEMMPGSSPTSVVAASAWKPLPEERVRQGVAAIVASRRQTGADNLDPALKATSRIHLVLARMEASRHQAMEAILLGSDGYVREGTASNVFLVKEGRLRTPSTACGILEGVTRAAILDLARGEGLSVEEGLLDAGELARADELFLTNTSWGALAVSRLDGRPVGAGRGGAVALRLGRKLSDLVDKECAS